MKYIILESPDFGLIQVLLFDQFISHNHMARVASTPNLEFVPVSAGFINKDGKAYGRSDSLNLESREGDTEIIATSLADQGQRP